MTLAHWALLLLAACAPEPVVGEARDAIAARAVDPLLSLEWTAESNLTYAYYGRSVSSAGDVNGDGYGDVIVGAADYYNPLDDEGRAFVYLGSAAGLDPSESWTAESNQEDAFFGWSVSSAGDVNGDGYDDVVVGAYYYDNGSTDEGRAYVYLGAAVGLDPSAAWTAESNQSYAQFGDSVSSAGDVNGDGYGDVVVGADNYDSGSTGVGRAYLFLGSAAGLDRSPSWIAEPNPTDAYIGESVSSAGDVNGDGYADVVIGAGGTTSLGRAYVHLGSAAGLDPIAAWTVEDDGFAAGFGNSVSSAGDVNDDGYGDVVVGALYYTNELSDEGRAYVYLGSAAGLDATAAWTAESNQEDAKFGCSVSSAGDVNGDGYGDVVIGADGYVSGTGRAYLYLGSAAGLDASAAWIEESPDALGTRYGVSVSSAGDVNGDGYADIVVGENTYSNGSTAEGRALLYQGRCYDTVDSDADSIADACDTCPGFDDGLDADVDGMPDDCDLCPTDADPGQEDDDADGMGDACDPCPANSPDADHDGFCEAQECDDTDPSAYPGALELCDAVDNDCDGVVPPDETDDNDGDTSPNCADCDDGDATRFPGAEERCNDMDDDCDGAVGPNEIDADDDLYSPCDGDCDDAETRVNSSLIELCGDGIDNNCDGEVDDACGSWDTGDTGCACNGASSFPGAASLVALIVLWQSARRRRWALLLSGCASDPMVAGSRDAIASREMDPILSLAWTAESDQDDAYFGYSVSSAGDVNGDGYGDVVVGAHGYPIPGRAFLYLGSATGLDPTATWTAESDQTDAYFGSSVSAAGDVNGDGYGDVVVGAFNYSNGQANEGQAYLYLGSTAGLDPTAAWIVESNQSSGNLGYSVSSAGDVNGDGYGDVVVGAEGFGLGGRVYVYLGSAASLDPNAAWKVGSDQGSAYFGGSVSSAGDVNDDGYGDVIVGAYGYDNPTNDEGRAYLYLGSAAGLDTNAAWTAESDRFDGWFGASVSSAGDVNGDGFGDVVVGAPGYSSGYYDLVDGLVYLFHGSAAGLDPTAAWTADSKLFDDEFGNSVSSAGDVNGDGYGDVVIGADGDSSEHVGRAYVHLGSAAGLGPKAAWTGSDLSDMYYGVSVSSAGDVNGDGFGDVVVGESHYANGSTDEGRALVYQGRCYDIVDSDADSIGDACDACDGFDDGLDADLDNVPDDCDLCPTEADPGQEDGDADGIGDACDPCSASSLDADDDGSCDTEDCDDADPFTYPGGTERCDGVDNDCNGVVPTDEIDDDGDSAPSCADCDDQDATRFPGAEEHCNDMDDDCDGIVGPNEIDADGDLYSRCDGDCDDADTRANSHLIEVCGDGIDNNCDGVIDEACGSEDTGCACSGAGVPEAPSFIALGVLLRAARRRRRGGALTP